MERDGAVARALDDCRRLPTDGTNSYPMRTGWEQELPKVPLLDRAEALLGLSTFVPDAWTRVLMARAYKMLGDLVRDPDIVCATMTAALADSKVSAKTRHALLLAAAMLRDRTALDGSVAIFRKAAADADAGPHTAITRRAMTRVRHGFLLSAAAPS